MVNRIPQLSGTGVDLRDSTDNRRRRWRRRKIHPARERERKNERKKEMIIFLRSCSHPAGGDVTTSLVKVSWFNSSRRLIKNSSPAFFLIKFFTTFFLLTRAAWCLIVPSTTCLHLPSNFKKKKMFFNVWPFFSLSLCLLTLLRLNVVVSSTLHFFVSSKGKTDKKRWRDLHDYLNS